MTDPIRADDVEAERVEFLWGGRIPKGMITTVAGRPDQGKGLFAAHVAAQVSAAGGRVLYSAAEDSHGLMTKPRLEAAGADLTNVVLWRFALPMNREELEMIVTDCRTLVERTESFTVTEVVNGVPTEVVKPNPDYIPEPLPVSLLVMDPFASHLSNGISRHSDNVRQVLGPLTTLIESTGTAVLIIEHALKRIQKGGDPLQAIGGSGSGLPAASRAAYVFGVDPDDPDRRILAKAKFNIGSAPLALAFEVDVADHEEVGDVPMLIADEELQAFDAMRLFVDKNDKRAAHRPPDKRAAAAEWLTTYLAAAGGPVLGSKIAEDAKQYAMSQRTLRRAADDMEIVKNPPSGRNCTWDLPDKVKTLMGIPTAASANVGTDETDENDETDGTVEESATITDDDLSELLGGGDV